MFHDGDIGYGAVMMEASDVMTKILVALGLPVASIDLAEIISDILPGAAVEIAPRAAAVAALLQAGAYGLIFIDTDVLLAGGDDLHAIVSGRPDTVVLMGDAEELPQHLVVPDHKIAIPFTQGTVAPLVRRLLRGEDGAPPTIS